MLLPASLAAQKSPPPTNVTVGVVGEGVTIAWAPVRSKGMTYRVLRALDAKAVGEDLTAPIDVTTFQDLKVAPGTTYFYQVVAVYADGTTGVAAPVAFALPAPAIVQPVTIPSGRAGAQLNPPVAPAPAGMGTRAPLIPLAGPPPSGVVVTGTPVVAHLAWNAMPNAQRYAVWRGEGANVSVEVTPAGFTGTQFQDVVPDPRLTYRYSVIAYYPNGTSGEAPPVQFTSPALINPPGFTARDLGQGGVGFQWQAVPGAVRYRLDGPGLPNTGYFTLGTSTGYPHVPAGQDTWRLVALYPGNNADYPGASTASAVMRVLPPHSRAWLSKNNGSGAMVQVQTPAFAVYNDEAGGLPFGHQSGDLASGYDPAYAAWLGQPFVFHDESNVAGGFSGGWFPPSVLLGPSTGVQCTSNARGCDRVGLKLWLDTYSKLWDDPGQARNEAVYGNPGDLGVGRRAFCEQRLRGPSVNYADNYVPGLYTLCYATAHGIPPGQTGFNDPQTITHPQQGIGPDFILAMVITKDPTGTVFLVLGKNGKYTLSPTVQLDTEGPKLVPFACLSCHGGTYNPATRKVDGASLLPLDPGLLAFASPADQAMQEEKIRSINLMIHNSDPASAVAAYIRGLYNGVPIQAGLRAQPDYVPAGWAPQAGFYRSVVRPYCTTCHLAAPTQWNFASWGNFQSNAGLIRAAVCSAHTMPHSELQYKAFWTKDTGPLYLPGLLAATLGFPSCP